MKSDSRRCAPLPACPGRLSRAVLLLATGLLAAVAHAAAPVDDWLRGAEFGADELGLVALPLDGGPPLLRHNASRPMNPASTMKLLTTAAALSLLGPDHRWRTQAFLRGRLHGDTLHGDLVLRGGGDPKLVVEDLAAFVAQMREAGVRHLHGDLVLDDAVFDLGGESSAPLDGDASQPYNVAPDGLLMNFKSSRLRVAPAQRGVTLDFDPPLAGVHIENRVRLLSGPCTGGLDALKVESADGPPPSIRVAGAYPRACGEQGLFVSVLSHRVFDEALFRGVWEAAGGSWRGHARVERGAGAGLGRPWLEWTSPRTLADVVRDVNKYSNNVMARAVFLALGADAAPGTPRRARRALDAWLSEQGLTLPGLFIDNGSGLSRATRVTPDGLARLLVRAAAGPHADLLRESLPQVGVDGTMKSRLAAEDIAGRAWIKTGSLEGVRAIAGYVDGASGRRWAVVLLVNAAGARSARPLQDEFLRWVRANG